MTPTSAVLEVPKRLMSVEEFWDFVNLPKNKTRLFELRRGEVVEVSRPTKPHGVVCTRIGTQLQNYADRVDLGYVTNNDSGVVLEERPGTVVGPDVAYFVDVNHFDDIDRKWGGDIPVLAVEVLSPNDKPSEVKEKLEDYLASGVKVVWIVDYEEKSVVIHRPDGPSIQLKVSDELDGGPELPGFRCRVFDFFRLPGDRQVPTA